MKKKKGGSKHNSTGTKQQQHPSTTTPSSSPPPGAIAVAAPQQPTATTATSSSSSGAAALPAPSPSPSPSSPVPPSSAPSPSPSPSPSLSTAPAQSQSQGGGGTTNSHGHAGPHPQHHAKSGSSSGSGGGNNGNCGSGVAAAAQPGVGLAAANATKQPQSQTQTQTAQKQQRPNLSRSPSPNTSGGSGATGTPQTSAPPAQRPTLLIVSGQHPPQQPITVATVSSPPSSNASTPSSTPALLSPSSSPQNVETPAAKPEESPLLALHQSKNQQNKAVPTATSPPLVQPSVQQESQQPLPPTQQDQANIVQQQGVQPQSIERSSSAPPVLLTSDALFAFRPEEYALQDIRCQEDYYEFYYKSDQKGCLPAPLETQGFLVEKSVAEDIPTNIPLEGFTQISQVRQNPSNNFFDYNFEPQKENTARLYLNSPALADSSPVWSPLTRKIASAVLDDFDLDDEHPGTVNGQLTNLTNGNVCGSPLSEDSGISNGSLLLAANSHPSRSQLQQHQAALLQQAQIQMPSQQMQPRPPPSLSADINSRENTYSLHNSLPSVPHYRYEENPPEKARQVPTAKSRCRFYLQGCCVRENCPFLHELPGSQQPPISHTPPSHLQAPASFSVQSSAPPISSHLLLNPHTGIPTSTSPPPAIGMGGVIGANYIPKSVNPNAAAVTTSWNSRKPSPEEVMKNFPPIESLIGRLYGLCQDQFGCRYLQKQLDEGDPTVASHIFNEVVDYMSVLMADPFGNYLAQKILEHATDTQRYRIVQVVAKDLERISMNMHGTRAVQKLIENLKNPEEIRLVRESLRHSVVRLIQDLNGNHVIQRCLHVLQPADKQFIYDAVTEEGHIVDVATHRHGCCVLQRCIDHASDQQKAQLVHEIVNNSLPLVQDPFGNYVVQYVLELPLANIARGLAHQLKGYIAELSMQKFSSNVMEKIIQSGDLEAKYLVVKEITESPEIATLLQDPFGNYVVQTALSHADPSQHRALVEKINPHLPQLRNTPYGKRIQTKVMKEGRNPILIQPPIQLPIQQPIQPQQQLPPPQPTHSPQQSQQQPQQPGGRRHQQHQQVGGHRG
ncbi:armadillo-type protein [Pelomyxa schiedti]|nr:armadillo-type protein [Pelomyxa schiedti]